jgi:hypothetical protein
MKSRSALGKVLADEGAGAGAACSGTLAPAQSSDNLSSYDRETLSHGLKGPCYLRAGRHLAAKSYDAASPVALSATAEKQID